MNTVRFIKHWVPSLQSLALITEQILKNQCDGSGISDYLLRFHHSPAASVT